MPERIIPVWERCKYFVVGKKNNGKAELNPEGIEVMTAMVEGGKYQDEIRAAFGNIGLNTLQALRERHGIRAPDKIPNARGVGAPSSGDATGTAYMPRKSPFEAAKEFLKDAGKLVTSRGVYWLDKRPATRPQIMRAAGKEMSKNPAHDKIMRTWPREFLP